MEPFEITVSIDVGERNVMDDIIHHSGHAYGVNDLKITIFLLNQKRLPESLWTKTSHLKRSYWTWRTACILRCRFRLWRQGKWTYLKLVLYIQSNAAIKTLLKYNYFTFLFVLLLTKSKIFWAVTWPSVGLICQVKSLRKIGLWISSMVASFGCVTMTFGTELKLSFLFKKKKKLWKKQWIFKIYSHKNISWFLSELQFSKENSSLFGALCSFGLMSICRFICLSNCQ